MTIEVKCLAKSKQNGTRPILASFECRYPRAAVHEEFMTHRMLSRNATSSRATPAKTMIDQIRHDPAIPVYWGKATKQMVDAGPMSPEVAAEALKIYLEARDAAIAYAQHMMVLTEMPHKQIINLLLRPWEHITVVTSGTEWANFFALRRHKDAKPEFRELADKMWAAYQETPTRLLKPGEWHLPYIQQHEWDSLALAKDKDKSLNNLIKVSAARCARTSYKNYRGKTTTFFEDIELYDRLVGGYPLHASPMEHQATPDEFDVSVSNVSGKVSLIWKHPELHGNFTGFCQHRKTLANENITKYTGEDDNGC